MLLNGFNLRIHVVVVKNSKLTVAISMYQVSFKRGRSAVDGNEEVRFYLPFLASLKLSSCTWPSFIMSSLVYTDTSCT